MRENLALNEVGQGCTVVKLDWTQFGDKDVAALGPVDVILMADCWYDVDVQEACVSTVARICRANPGCYFINATALRNPRTYSVYHEAFIRQGFFAEPLHVNAQTCSIPGLKDKYVILLERFSLFNQERRHRPLSQSSSRVLMCSPDQFAWSPEAATDNSFMSAAPTSDLQSTLQLIQASHTKWVNLLRQHGVMVDVFRGDDPKAPDAVFPNNWFSTHVTKEGKRCIALFPMAHPSRRRERRDDIIAHLKAMYPDECLDLTHWEHQGKYFEGTGSAVVDWLHGIVFVSLSTRAHPEVAQEWVAWLSKIHEREFQSVFFSSQHRGAPVYHTNVVMSIGSQYAVCCFDVLHEAHVATVRLALRRSIIVEITPAQMEALCANVLELCVDGQRYCVMSTRAFNAFTPAQRQQIEDCNVQLLVSDLDLLETLGGGGIRCCLAELF